MSHYERAGILPITILEIVPAYPTKQDVAILHGKEVKLDSVRYRVYAQKGTACVRCGMRGDYFAVERDRYQKAPKGKPIRFHLNLYHRKDDGTEIMMTVNHIVPKAHGGPRVVENLEPMCIECNELLGAARTEVG